MPRIPLSFESYQDASLPMSAKRLLDLYAEETPADARAPVKLAPTPGLCCTLPSSSPTAGGRLEPARLPP